MSQAVEQDKETRDAMLDIAKDVGLTEEEFDAIHNAVSKGARLADALNINPDVLEAGYAFGYNLYTAGNYKDAETMFRGLCLYDPDDPRYWMGLGGCLQAREEYTLAIDTYGMAGVAGAMQDPTPFYYGGLCYLKLNNAENAIAAFKSALTFGKNDNPAHQACHEKVQAVLCPLEEALKKAQS